MDTRPSERPREAQAIEFLARESQVPIDKVAQLYRAEWATLEEGARITAFLAIRTHRNVRETLRRRRVGMRPVA